MLRNLDKEKAYVLGFFHADGSYGINRKKYIVHGETRVCEQAYFHIGSTDKEVMEFISNVLGIKVIVSEDRRKDSYKTYYRINSHNKEIVSDLEYHGYKERKHESINHFPIIDDSLMPDFLRGFLDGDGNASSSNGLVRFYITEDITLNYIKDYLDRVGIGYHVYYQERKTMKLRELRIAAKSRLDFFNLLYNGGFCLERKRQEYIKIVQGIVSAHGNMG